MKVIDIRSTIPVNKKRKPKKRYKAKYIVVHTTASKNQDPNRTAKYHVTASPRNHISKRGAPTMCYHDFITKDGTLYHCVNYTSITWHAKGLNNYSIGLVMAFKGQTGEAPTTEQYNTLVRQLVTLCLYMKILPKHVLGHREVPRFRFLLGLLSKAPGKFKKTCPGMGVDLDKLRKEITGRLQRRLAAEGLYKGKIDYLFGRKSKAALKAFKPKSNTKWNGYGI